MLPVQPRNTEHVGVRVMRSKSESLFGAFVNIPRLVQLNRRARLLSDRPERYKGHARDPFGRNIQCCGGRFSQRRGWVRGGYHAAMTDHETECSRSIPSAIDRHEHRRLDLDAFSAARRSLSTTTSSLGLRCTRTT